MLNRIIMLLLIIAFPIVGFAGSKKTCSANTMPRYKITFTLPAKGNKDMWRTFVLRYYQAWGHGEETGWQTLANFPTATLNGQPFNLIPAFNYYTGYDWGAVGLGFDQYAQYVGGQIPEEISAPSKLVITGTFSQVAYMSATLYVSYFVSEPKEHLFGTQRGFLDKEFEVEEDCNPYVAGNPSVFAYPTESVTKRNDVQANETRDTFVKFFRDQRPTLFKSMAAQTENGKVDVFRLNKYESRHSVADDIAADGCSRAYLFARITADKPVAILRIKVPKTFIENDAPDKTFGHYQTRYFSVGAHRNLAENPSGLTYWAAHAGMLKKYQDKDGYAYVFFVPDAYSKQLADEQNTLPTVPPVLTWGQYTGYVLGEPDFAIILRYRDPDPAWKGSPENATCYTLPENVQPVSKKELDDYTPEIFADTMENFQNGKIGAVSKDLAWPD